MVSEVDGFGEVARRRRARCCGGGSSSTVTICTGMWRVDASCLSRASTVQPSMSGRKMSSVIAVGPVLAHQPQRFVAAVGEQHLEAARAREVAQHRGVMRVVLDDQQRRRVRHQRVRGRPRYVSAPRARRRRRRARPAAGTFHAHAAGAAAGLGHVAVLARCRRSSSGRYSVNVLPSPSTLCSLSSPPSRPAISRLIARPRPGAAVLARWCRRRPAGRLRTRCAACPARCRCRCRRLRWRPPPARARARDGPRSSRA